jgi:hypothetical protein
MRPRGARPGIVLGSRQPHNGVPHNQQCEYRHVADHHPVQKDVETPVRIHPAEDRSGKREPLAHDPKGFFVITIDRSKACIIAQHDTPDAHPGYVMRGRSSEGMWLALMRKGLSLNCRMRPT